MSLTWSFSWLLSLHVPLSFCGDFTGFPSLKAAHFNKEIFHLSFSFFLWRSSNGKEEEKKKSLEGFFFLFFFHSFFCLHSEPAVSHHLESGNDSASMSLCEGCEHRCHAHMFVLECPRVGTNRQHSRREKP